MVEAAADLLRSVPYARIYVSDLRRARQTAAVIVAARRASGGVPDDVIVYNPLVREKHAGSFEGKKAGSQKAAARSAGTSPRRWTPQGGENWDDVLSRAQRFVQQLRTESFSDAASVACGDGAAEGARLESGTGGPARHVLIVSHGGWIKEFMNAVIRIPAAKARGEKVKWYPNSLRNASLTTVRLRWHESRLHEYQRGAMPDAVVVVENERAHLRTLRMTSPDRRGRHAVVADDDGFPLPLPLTPESDAAGHDDTAVTDRAAALPSIALGALPAIGAEVSAAAVARDRDMEQQSGHRQTTLQPADIPGETV